MSDKEDKKPIPAAPIPDITLLFKMGLNGTGFDPGRPPSEAEAYDAMQTAATLLQAAKIGDAEFTRTDGKYDHDSIDNALATVVSKIPVRRAQDRPLETHDARALRVAKRTMAP